VWVLTPTTLEVTLAKSASSLFDKYLLKNNFDKDRRYLELESLGVTVKDQTKTEAGNTCSKKIKQYKHQNIATGILSGNRSQFSEQKHN
jgi:hypothetical protein